MRIKLLFILLGLCLLTVLPVFSANEKKVIRVGISNQSFSTYEHTRTRVISDSPISVTDLSNNAKIEPLAPFEIIEITLVDGSFNIYMNNNPLYGNLKGPLLLSSNSDIGLVDLNRKGTPAKYKGMIELRLAKSGNAFHIINVLDVNSYIRGVVPNEMPVSFGLEALKAQSIAAKNYAQNASINQYYDVVDSTASQVYYGVNSYRDISDKAVNETLGIYALYKEKPITALYFSTSPGITDDWDDVFGNGYNSNTHPYLRASYDKAGQKPLKNEFEVRDFYSSLDGGLDKNSPKYRWEVTFERTELEEILNKTLLEQSKAGLVNPKYDGTNKLQGLKEIKPIRRTQSGKIIELLISAKTGDYTIKKELGIRRVLKKNNAMLPSANFFVDSIGKEELSVQIPVETEEIALVNSEDPNKDESFVAKIFNKISTEKYPEKFKLTGGGFGHCVGMSQFGAYNMAKMGRKYPDILKHYYKNIDLSTMPKTVLFNEYNVFYKSEFYFDKQIFKTAYLYVNNQKGVSEFPFKINEYEFLETKSAAQNRSVKMDITPYLKQGVNTVTFAPLTKENKGKYVEFRIEFQ